MLGTFGLMRGTVLARELELAFSREPSHASETGAESLAESAAELREIDRKPQALRLTPHQLNSSSVTPHDPFAHHSDSDDQLGLRFDEPHERRRIWAVCDLVAQVREIVEQEYGDIWVEGEISNLPPCALRPRLLHV